MDLIDDTVIPEDKIPIDPDLRWDDEGNTEYDDEYYEDVIYECYR